MPADLIQPATSLGVAGFAILIMWWMYQNSSARLDKAYEDHKALEKEVRDKIMDQLNRNTTAFDRVLDHFNNSSPHER